VFGLRATFSSFVFSACSSLPALSACLFSDFAVNYCHMLAMGEIAGVCAHLQVEESILEARHGGSCEVWCCALC